ncbi:platelet-derived growth factor C-like [Carassius auratus]|uniref:Platelet-derived growth factor C n=1 Tax=Carassius auratus TaxID=7957 RepID=A0A6P6P0U9_CARAU|nr:platelet-derived growth factor C-like [Carassius auratus]
MAAGTLERCSLTDESRFSSPVQVKFADVNIVDQVAHDGSGVMKYRDEIPRPIFIPFNHNHHDNARPHQGIGAQFLYDYVEVEEPVGGVVLGRWCGSEMVPGPQVSKGNQILIRFVSDEYFPSDPGFCIHYSLLQQRQSEPETPPVMPAWMQSVDVLSEAVAGFSTMEEVMKYLEPERWQVDIEDLYKPSWQVVGKSFFHQKKSRGAVDLNLLREEVRLYSCTPRNFSVSLREELKRTDAIFWPSCLLVKRCGGNCACCSHNCYDCQCSPTKVAKKYHEVLMLKHRAGGRGLQKTLTDVPLEHHEECSCVCKNDSD